MSHNDSNTKPEIGIPDNTADVRPSNPAAGALTEILDHFFGRDHIAPHNEVITYATETYLAHLDSADAPSPREIERQLLAIVNGVIKAENAKTKVAGEKLALRKDLSPVQVALVVDHFYHVAEVTPEGTDADDGLGVLAIYQDSGEFEGLYRRVDLGLLEDLARQYNFSNDEKWFKEFERALRGFAPKVTETTDPDLVVMRNLIYNYRTDERIGFSPDYVFLARNSEVDLIEQQHPVPEVFDKGGNVIWNYEDWWGDTVPDADTGTYIHQVIGAAFRPGHDWQTMVAFHSETGSNGKGTILAHIRALIGSRNCASVPLRAYGSQFGKTQLIGKRLNMPDETPVGDFIKDASDLKAIITNDPVTIDRKHKDPITYKPRMFTIVTLNGPLNFRDKTESMDRRLALVPMQKRFTNGSKNKSIKDDYLLRREVCEYIAYKVLVEMPKYWKLDEPAEVKQALQEHKRETNTVLAFFEEYKDTFHRPFVPFPMLHAHYSAWLRENRYGSTPVEAATFTREVKALFNPQVWVVPCAADGSDLKINTRSWLTTAEGVLDEFHYLDSVNKWQWEDIGHGVPRGLAKSAPRQARGLMRRDVYEAWVAAGCRGGSEAANDAVREAQRQRQRVSAGIRTADAQRRDGGEGVDSRQPGKDDPDAMIDTSVFTVAAADQPTVKPASESAAPASVSYVPSLSELKERLADLEAKGEGGDKESAEHKLVRLEIEIKNYDMIAQNHDKNTAIAS